MAKVKIKRGLLRPLPDGTIIVALRATPWQYQFGPIQLALLCWFGGAVNASLLFSLFH